MGPKSAGRSSSGPKSDEPAYPPALGCGLGTLPAGSRGLLCGSDRQRRVALPVASSSYLLVPSSRAEAESPSSDFYRLPTTDGRWIFAAPRRSSSYRAPAATRRARGRKEGDACRVTMGVFYFVFTIIITFYCGGAATAQRGSTPTTRRPARPAAATASCWYAREGYGGPARLNVAGSRRPARLGRAPPHWQLRSRLTRK